MWNVASCVALEHPVAWKPSRNYGTDKVDIGDGRHERGEHNEFCAKSDNHTAAKKKFNSIRYKFWAYSYFCPTKTKTETNFEQDIPDPNR